MKTVIFVAIGGAIGALSRVGVSAACLRLFGDRFAWGTVTVNVVGCLLFGFVWAFTEERVGLREYRPLVITGFMGSFTTFSTYAFEISQDAGSGRLAAAVGSFTLQNAAGIGCMLLGFALARAMA